MKKIIMIIPALLCSVAANSYAYDGRATYSVDQLFDNSLEELKDAMRKAKESNEELKAQNRLLREQVVEMEDAVLDVAYDEPVAVVPASDSLSDEEILAQEQKLYQARLENLAMRHDRLSSQNKRLEKNVDLYAKENRETQERIAALKEEVADIQLALKADEKPKVAKANKKSPALQKQLAAKKEQIRILEKKLAAQKDALKGQLSQKEKYESQNEALQEKLTSGREELALLQRGEKVLGKPQKTLDRSSQDEAMTRQDIAELENTRNELKVAINDLKKASASTKAAKSMDLEKILKIYRDQQAMLQKKLDTIQPGSSLLVRKESLLAEQQRLEDQIAQAQSAPSARGADLASVSELKKSEQRVQELKQKLEAARNSSPLQKRNEELSGKVAVLQQDLQNLRDNPYGQMTAKDAKEVKEEIAQLEARRVMLADAVQDIYDRYNMNELPKPDALAKEVHLKEYFQTLRLENTALQQKLLTLQMRQDKNAPAIR